MLECEAAIRRAILGGEFAPGDRLPPERAYAEALGVGRTTLRAALARLVSARLLTVRQGSGYVVQDYRAVAGLELLPELAALAEARGESLAPMIRDLLAVRRAVARIALERLVERAQRGDLVTGAIERAVADFASAVERGEPLDALAEADLGVTAAILDATGSRVLGLILNPLSHVVRDLAPLKEAIYRAPESNVASYRLLLSWLAAPRRDAIDLVIAELERRDEATVARFADR